MICTLVSTASAAPKVQSTWRSQSLSTVNFVSPTASSARASSSKRRPELNFDPSSSNKKHKRTATTSLRQQKKQKDHGPISQVNIMEWNISGLRSEADTWLYLNHIETEWPHVQLVLLTESHLRSHDINTELTNNSTWEVHPLPQRDSSYTNWGGIVLLARKGMFSIHRQQDFQDDYLDAAVWAIEHSSWEHPLLLAGLYRNHPAGKNQGDPEIQARREHVENMHTQQLHGK